MNFPDHFEIAQQSRDAVAVIRAGSEESAFIFGNSSGAVIALDMVATQPEAVRGAIAHGPPLARIHPNAQKWQKFFHIDPHIPLERVHETSRVLSALGAVVTERIYPGMGHTINDDEIKHIRAILAKFATHSAELALVCDSRLGRFWGI